MQNQLDNSLLDQLSLNLIENSSKFLKNIYKISNLVFSNI